MIINFDQILKSIKGEELTENGKPITLRDVCYKALVTQTDDQKTMLPATKFEMHMLATKIYNGGKEIDFISDDITKIKNQIGKVYFIEYMGAAWNLLEDNKKKTAKELKAEAKIAEKAEQAQAKEEAK